MAALSRATLIDLPERIERPAYDRHRVAVGIAHLGVGNFHRAHQAVHLDRILAQPGQEGWGICGIGVVDTPAERARAASLARQDGIYKLTVLPPRGEPTTAVIGSIVDCLFAPADPPAVVARLGEPAIRIVSLTITEGAYNIDEATGMFRLDEPGVAHDLAHPETPRTAFGLITAGLALRHARGLLPCASALSRRLVSKARAFVESFLCYRATIAEKGALGTLDALGIGQPTMVRGLDQGPCAVRAP
jgi:mannitol 2-dehydrogenase